MEYTFRNGETLRIDYDGEIHIDEDIWRTNDEGKHYLIGEDGTIKAGFGGKLNGVKIKNELDNYTTAGIKKLAKDLGFLTKNKDIESIKQRILKKYEELKPIKVDIHQPLNDLRKALTQYGRYRTYIGQQESLTQAVVNAIGGNKPTVLSKQDFQEQSKGKMILYRGVQKNKYGKSAKAIVDSFKHSKHTYIGSGFASGDGIYFSNDEQLASGYAKNGGKVIKSFLNEKANIIKKEDLIALNNRLPPKEQFNMADISVLAIQKGYNVIQVREGNEMVILDKSVLTVED